MEKIKKEEYSSKGEIPKGSNSATERSDNEADQIVTTALNRLEGLNMLSKVYYLEKDDKGVDIKKASNAFLTEEKFKAFKGVLLEHVKSGSSKSIDISLTIIQRDGTPILNLESDRVYKYGKDGLEKGQISDFKKLEDCGCFNYSFTVGIAKDTKERVLFCNKFNYENLAVKRIIGSSKGFNPEQMVNLSIGKSVLIRNTTVYKGTEKEFKLDSWHCLRKSKETENVPYSKNSYIYKDNKFVGLTKDTFLGTTLKEGQRESLANGNDVYLTKVFFDGQNYENGYFGVNLNNRNMLKTPKYLGFGVSGVKSQEVKKDTSKEVKKDTSKKENISINL